jgi:hypothetical protein
MSNVTKLAPASKQPSRPSDAAIDALLDDPSRASQFDAKYGPDMAKTCIMRRGHDRVGDLLDAIEAVEAKLDEVIDLIKAPRRIILDGTDKPVATVFIEDDELRGQLEDWCDQAEAQLRKQRKSQLWVEHDQEVAVVATRSEAARRDDGGI